MSQQNPTPSAAPPGDSAGRSRGAGPQFEDVLASVAGIQGWMTDDQARLLWDSAHSLVPGERVVEIGSYQGRSTIVLASAVPDGVTVIAIDPHAGTDRGPEEIVGKEIEAENDSQSFQRSLEEAGVRHRVDYLRQWSDAALGEVGGMVELLYIDGAHRFGPAKADIDRWGGRVVAGGTLLIHDSFSSIGVTLAILASLTFSSQWRYEGRAQSMTCYRRTTVPLGERPANIGRQLARLPWFARNVLFKVLIKAGLRPVALRLGHDPAQEWPF
ncbi:MAG: class I SAM-dependent methyltransferase [Acidimicrobiales bacterium]